MSWKKKSCCVMFLLAIALVMVPPSCLLTGEKIGVIFVIHGGMIDNKPQYMWDAVAHQFSYDPNHLESRNVAAGSGTGCY